MAAKKPPPERRDSPAPRYRILSGGISTPNGTRWRGEVVSAAELGDASRVARLLDKRSIEEAADDD